MPSKQQQKEVVSTDIEETSDTKNFSKIIELSDYISNYQEQTKELLSKLNELKSEVGSIEKEMSKRQKEINSTVEKMTKTTTLISKSEMVQLNIGGTCFATTLSILTGEKGTFFRDLFSELFYDGSSPKTPFIARDPTYFRIILNHMSGYNVKETINALKDHEKDILAQDIKFYRIASMFHFFPEMFKEQLEELGISAPVSKSSPQFDPSYCSSNITLSQGNCRLKKTSGGTAWNAGAMGTKCDEYTIKLISNCNDLMVGMAPRSNFKTNGNNYTSCGWYLYCANGTLYSQGGDSDSDYIDSACNQPGAVIGVKLQNGNLSFIINGTDYGTAYSGLSGDLYPAFDVEDSGCEFEFQTA